MDGRNLTPEMAANRSTDLQHPTEPQEHHDHEDLEDAQPFSSSEHAQLNRRRGSDAATLRTMPRQQLTGSIRVDRSRVKVGETVGVVWDLSGRGVDGAAGNHNDFLGLFEVVEGGAPIDAENLLDSRLRGFNSSQSGRINWTILSDHLHGRASVKVCFCYFDHQHTLRAQSSTFTIFDPHATSGEEDAQHSCHVAAGHSEEQTPFDIHVYDLLCQNLRSKLFGAPDPFLKLHVTCRRGFTKLAHHNQKASTGTLYGTVNPMWTELLTFRALPSDVLEITVRDKFAANRPAISHFLGRVKVQLSEFLQYRGAKTLTFDLQKRLPSDRISGRISLTVENRHLPPNPALSLNSSETQHAEVTTRESNGAPANILHPSALLRVSRLTSLSSEDSVSIGDVLAAVDGVTDSSQEVGGATPTGDSTSGREAVSTSEERVSDDVIAVDESGTGGQSSGTGAAIAAVQVREQSSEATATAKPATAETAEGGANSVAMEMTSSEPNEPPVTSGDSAGIDESSAAANIINQSPAHKKKKLSDTLDRIRTTLYGSGRRLPLPATGGKRRSHTVLSRHESLRVHPASSHGESGHNLLRSQKLSGSISMFQLHADMAADMTESLPPNWEVRSGASGMPLYYDHENKVVRLDRPVGATGETSPRISDFVRRANLNLLQRQPSLPPPAVTDPSNENAASMLGRSNTISGPGDERARSRPRYRRDAQTSPVQSAEPKNQTAIRNTAASDDKDTSSLIISDDKEKSEKQATTVDDSVTNESDKKEREGSMGGASDSRTTVPFLQVSAAEEGEKVEVHVHVEGQGAAPSELKGSAGSESVAATTAISPEEKEEKASTEGEGEIVKSKMEDKEEEEATAEHEGEEGEDSAVHPSLALTRKGSIEDTVRESPGFCFITRPDLYKFAKEVGNEKFFKNLAILELIQTIRSDHTLFTKYQHSSKLVKVINSFALTERDLPSGWEKRVDPNTKRHVFIDHNSRQTTFIDPRLPYPGNKLTVTAETEQIGVVTRSRPYVSDESDTLQPRPSHRPRLPSSFTPSSTEEPRITRHSSVSALSRLHVEPLSPTPLNNDVPHPPQQPPPSVERQSSQSSYSERVVTFLRQPNIFTLLRSRYEETVSYNLRAAIEMIQREGVPALEQMQQDQNSLYLDLTIILSLFDEEISHFTFPVPTITTTSSSDSNGVTSAAAAALPDRNVPRLSPESSRQTEHLLSSLSSTSSDVQISTLNFDLNERLEQPGQQNSTVDRGNHTYGGIPLDYIIEFFHQPNIYHHVLSRYNGITADDREFIEWFQRTNRGAAEDRLDCTTALRNFVDGLRTRIDEYVSLAHPDSTHTGSVGGASPRDSQHLPPQIENHMLAGMTIEQILTFFRSAAEQRRTLAPHVLMPVMDELSVDELEELLCEDATLRAVVMRYQDEINNRPFPTITQIKNFFRQPNIYSTIAALNVTNISLEDRATVERIINTPADLLSERLLWDRTMSRFISNLSSAIFQFDVEAPPTNRRISPTTTLQLSPSSLTTPTPPKLGSFSSRSKKQEFIEKLRELQRKLEQGGYGDPDEAQNASFGRETLLADAYQFVMGTSAKDLRRRRLNARWDREEGLDYGGPQREFFFKLSRLLFNPYYGLFEYSASGSYTVQISHLSAMIADAHQWFRFAGRLIGYAIIQGQLLDVFFARHVYKALLGSSYTVSDVEAIDIPFYNSLKYVLENDPEPLDLTFTVLEETFGEVTEYELKPGGAYIPVVPDNKHEYVELMVQWRLSNGTGPQTENLVKGLREMIPRQYLSSFDAQELEWVIAGTPEINLDDWKNNTIYWGGYHKDHHIIKWFWEIVEAYSTEQKLRLLQFVTGTSSIPFEGFRALRGSNSLQKFTIDRKSGGRDAILTLPIAHTCFNRIDLPEYLSFEMLAEKLTLAIEECGTFENA